MLRNKIWLLFLLKAVIIYGFLSLPFSFNDAVYGNFYRKVAGTFFNKFRETGIVEFRKLDDPTRTQVFIGNRTQVDSAGHGKTPTCFINTRYMGYLPAILLISLVLASPVPWRRKLVALAAGLILVTLLILFVQWIILLWTCDINPWLQLTNFTKTGKKLVTLAYDIFTNWVNSVPSFVVVIWLLVTFRLDDFKSIPQSAGKKR